MGTTDTNIDFFTKERRRENVPYTFMSEQQIKSIQKKSSPLFFTQPPKKPDKPRQYMHRYTYFDDRAHYRDTRNTDFTYIGPYVSHELPLDHDSSRFGALFPWGPDKVGHRTLKNSLQQDCHRFVNVDMYKRNPTNYPGEIQMKYGRPNYGYYAQRNQNDHMWFGGENRPTQHWILTDIRSKTFAEHRAKTAAEQAEARQKLPFVSHYTKSMLLRQPTEVTLYGKEKLDQMIRSARTEQNRTEEGDVTMC